MYSRLFELLVEGKTTGSDPVATGRRVARAIHGSWNSHLPKNARRVSSINDRIFKRAASKQETFHKAHKITRSFIEAKNKRRRDLFKSKDSENIRSDKTIEDVDNIIAGRKAKYKRTEAFIKGTRTK